MALLVLFLKAILNKAEVATLEENSELFLIIHFVFSDLFFFSHIFPLYLFNNGNTGSDVKFELLILAP